MTGSTVPLARPDMVSVMKPFVFSFDKKSSAEIDSRKVMTFVNQIAEIAAFPVCLQYWAHFRCQWFALLQPTWFHVRSDGHVELD